MLIKPVDEQDISLEPEKTENPPQPIAMRRVSVDYATLATIVRQEIKRNGWEGCITSTRVVIEVLKRFGVEAAPLSVQTLVFNPFVSKHFSPNKPVPSKKALERYVSDRRGWSLGIGFEPAKPEPDKWSGHLVAVVKNGPEGVLIDASLDQATRKQYRIELFPVALEVRAALWEVGAQAFFKVNECSLIYKPILQDRSFEEFEDWTSLDVSDVIERAYQRVLIASLA